MKKSTILALPFIAITSLLVGCHAQKQTSVSRDHIQFKTQTVPLPYNVVLSGSVDDRMQCENCGNNGKKTFIKGGEQLSQYSMMIDSPYFVFLCNTQPTTVATENGLQLIKISSNRMSGRFHSPAIRFLAISARQMMRITPGYR